jgi:hypothetical protein
MLAIGNECRTESRETETERDSVERAQASSRRKRKGWQRGAEEEENGRRREGRCGIEGKTEKEVRVFSVVFSAKTEIIRDSEWLIVSGGSPITRPARPS